LVWVIYVEADFKRLAPEALDTREPGYATLFFSSTYSLKSMLFSKEYVGYLARQVAQKLIAGEFIEAKNVSEISAALNTALLEELQLEDRINDEVRLILEQYQDEMQRAGASYQEMFKKVKGELVRKYKAVL
jgi:hypothetical protein